MKFFILLILAFFLIFSPVFAQESLDWDIDTVFDEPPPENNQNQPETPIETTPEEGTADVLSSLIRRRGLTFNASYSFLAGISPGWQEVPWYDGENEFSWGQRANMRASFNVDAQISEVFRVKTVVYFRIPYFKFTLGDFFFDYNLLDAVFFRAGKFNTYWGISPNYSFANLLSRVPMGSRVREAYYIKTDIPIGVGGLQLLIQTRAYLMGGDIPGWLNLGYGAKYNLALRWADFDLGVFYHNDMPFRGFFSIKTTLGNTELYNEYLGSGFDDIKNFSGAVSLGVLQDFFDGKFSVNGEVFYNAENAAYFYEEETDISDAKISPYIDGLNLALNLVYRFSGKGSPRAFIQAKYAPMERTARLVPGFRFTPFRHTELYIAVPMALGEREGFYYSSTPDIDNRPFCVVLLLTIRGAVRAGYNY